MTDTSYCEPLHIPWSIFCTFLHKLYSVIAHFIVHIFYSVFIFFIVHCFVMFHNFRSTFIFLFSLTMFIVMHKNPKVNYLSVKIWQYTWFWFNTYMVIRDDFMSTLSHMLSEVSQSHLSLLHLTLKSCFHQPVVFSPVQFVIH